MSDFPVFRKEVTLEKPFLTISGGIHCERRERVRCD